MSEWWTYRPSDFLLFSATTYRRLFALYNEESWPGPLVGLAAGAAVLWLLLRGGRRSVAVACVIAAAGWLWVAWAFHLQRYATINWAAPWFAAGFGIEAAVLAALGLAIARDAWRPRLSPAADSQNRGSESGGGRDRSGRPTASSRAGIGLVVGAVSVYPALAGLLGASWRSAEVINLAPDPTVLGTLGLLLLLPPPASLPASRSARTTRWLAGAAWPIPLLWCAISGLTLSTLHAAEALLLPGAGLLACLSARRARRA